MIAAGALFYARNTNRFLLLHRTQGKRSQVWGLVGGSQELGETAWECCNREIKEEVGLVEIEKILPLEKFCTRDKSFEYHTYVCFIEEEFIPNLNHEHDGYAWVTYGKWPNPLHYGLKNTLAKKYNKDKLKTVLEVMAFHRNER